ncbi:hypothetical protein [Chitinimonas naiadis]
MSLARENAIPLENEPISIKEISAIPFTTSPFLEASIAQWALTNWVITKHIEILPDDYFTGPFSLDTWSKSFPTAILGLLPHGKFGQISRKQTADFRSRLLDSQKSWPDLNLHAMAAIFCVDSDKDRLPTQLYGSDLDDGEKFPSSRFEELVISLAKAVADNETILGRITNRKVALGYIISELFKNTHEHARNNYNGARLNHSIRSVYSRYFSAKTLATALSNKSGRDFNAVEGFIARQLRINSNNKSPSDIIGFLEISVLDSGPGLAQHWTKKSSSDLSIQEEFTAALSCLSKGRSTSQGIGKGFGLHNVIRTMTDLGGFVRLRTNRIHAFRAMDDTIGLRKDAEGSLLQTLYDWKRQYTERSSEYAYTEGCLISLLIPLEKE